MWAYFNVWDHFHNTHDRPFVFDLPFVVVPVAGGKTKKLPLSQKDEKKLVGYFSEIGPKVLPPSLLPKIVDGGHSCYRLDPHQIKVFDRIASEDNNFTDMAVISVCEFLYGQGPLNGSGWSMFVKRMRVPGQAELEELIQRAQRAAEDEEDADAEHGTSAEHGTVPMAVDESSAKQDPAEDPQ